QQMGEVDLADIGMRNALERHRAHDTILLKIWKYRKKTMTSAARTRLSPLAAFAVPAAIVGLALYASATPSPLYAVYQQRWHFSTPMVTVIYAMYPLGVLISLLALGTLSDQVGRRPVLRWSLVVLLGSMALFVAAQS